MTRYSLFFAFCLCFIEKTSFGQDTQTQDPIDKKYQSCLDSNSNTVGMIECMHAASQDWDKELNKYYKLLMTTLNPSAQSSLREAQRQWIVYKEKETKFYMDAYGKSDGSMWGLVIARRAMDIVRQRAIELKEYYDTLTEH